MASAPIIVEKFGRAYRVHSDDETTDSDKFLLIIKGMSAGSRLWTKRSYAPEALPDVLRAIADVIKGHGYSVILRT